MENDYPQAILNLGADARSLISEYPKIVKKIVEKLEKCLEIIDREELKRINKKMVFKELKSILNWEDREQSEIKEKINHIFEEYNIDSDDIERLG